VKVGFKLVGTSPLMPQSDRLVNPLDELTKEIRSYTKKRTKTDDDHHQIARLEWLGALYWDEYLGPYIPGENIAASFRDGGKISRKGTAIEQAFLVTTPLVPILYDGPRDRDALWKDERYRLSKSVGVKQARTIRTRPLFHEWALEAEAVLMEDVLDFADLRRVADDAGQLIGVGTYRRGGYGRYTVQMEAL
jgi:hypothetical protein